METFGGAVQLMLFVYAVAAVIAFITAWIIKLIFFVIQRRNGRAAAHRGAKHKSSATPAKAHAKGTS
jgi:hypothetical protein